MRTIYLILLVMFVSLLSYINGYGGETWTFQIDFDEENYTVVTHNGMISVESKNAADFKLHDGPSLPVRQFSIAIPSCLSFDSVSIDGGDVRELSAGVPLAKVMRPTYGVSVSYKTPTCYNDTISTFKIDMIGENDYQEVKILNFIVSPFGFIQNGSYLYLHKSVEVELTLVESDLMDDSPNISPLAAEMLGDIVINPEDLVSFVSKSHTYSLDDDYELINSASSGVDYLIITNEVLVDAFNDLLEWKKTKGLRSRIMTTQDIYAVYSGNTNQEKIKNCINTLYAEEGLSYVLLGGDTSLVPTSTCYIECEVENPDKSKSISSDEIPTDLYYACLSGQMDWDRNKNGVYGEVNDGCNLIPDVIVTRLPVCDYYTASTCVKKIIFNEKIPLLSFTKMMLLMAGVKIATYDSNGVCDSYQWGNYVLANSVYPFWNGNVELHFDSTSVKVINVEWLNKKLFSGCTFASIYSHGDTYSWALNETGPFDSDDVFLHKDNGMPGTIITTVACHTNDFRATRYDWNAGYARGKYCLSQAFMFAPYSSVVGYFGSSSSGWYHETDIKESPSIQYETSFYRALFSQPGKNKSFGRITTKAKLEMMARCDTSEYFRWLQFAINPVGDPEMQVFIQEPLTFSNVSISKTYVGTKLNYVIDTGELGCTICLKGMLNGRDSQVIFRNVQKIVTPYMPLNPTICITKDGFVPYVLEGAAILQGEDNGMDVMMNADYIVNCAFIPGTSTLGVLMQRSDADRSAQLIVSDIMGNTKISQCLDSCEAAELDMNGQNHGVYIVTLVLDGAPVDSKRVVK